MANYRTLFQLAAMSVVVSGFIYSFKHDPTLMQLATHHAMMQSDIQAIIMAGGKITDFDDNHKPTIARVYLILGVSADSSSESLRQKYTEILLGEGWKQVKSLDGKQFFCKQGVYASMLPPHDEYGMSLTMEFDTSSILQCKKLLPEN